MEFFIAGTDTDVGKTFVTGLLARAFVDAGYSVSVQKWVSTGSGSVSNDCCYVYRCMGICGDCSAGSDSAPYCMPFPASPHLAAEMAGVSIDTEKIRDACRRLGSTAGILLVEGVGGVFVPLSGDVFLIDLVGEMKMPVVIVARSGLGTLNHTFLTLEALRARGIKVAGVILNSQGGEDPVIVQDNVKTISRLGNVKVLGVIPRVEKFEAALPAVFQIIRYLVDFPGSRGKSEGD